MTLKAVHTDAKTQKTLDSQCVIHGVIYGVPEGQDARLIADKARVLMPDDKVLVHIALDDARMATLQSLLAFFAPDVRVVQFPAWDCLPYDRVSPNGDIYIVDGYGSQKVFQFDKSFKHLKTIGGSGKDHGKFNTCHGVWVSTLNKEPELYIADRGNNRLEVLSLEMEYKRTVEGVRTPCCFYQHDGHLYVPELGSRVTVIDAKDKIVAQMGDGSGIKDDISKHPGKFKAPHALTLDSKGNLYVLEWLGQGRIQKFNKG